MGGESGTFEGKKKLEAWLNFKAYLRERGLDTPEDYTYDEEIYETLVPHLMRVNLIIVR